MADTKAPQLIAAFALTWALGVVFVGLRLLARKITKYQIWVDDWLIIISLLWSGVFMFDVTCWMASHGFGKHIEADPPAATKAWAIGLFITEFAYTLGIVFVKWSILALYWRVFNIESTIRPLIWALFCVVCAWGLAVILVTIFQCLPVYAFWERFNPIRPMPASQYSCSVSVYTFFLGSSIPNILTDMLLILLPMPYIWKMTIPWSQKVAITGIFVVGIFVTIVSGVRLFFVLTLDLSSPDVTWNQSDEMMWTGVEVNIATVCACLPTLRPLLNLLIYGTVHTNLQRPSVPGIDTIGGSGEAAKKWSLALRRARPTPAPTSLGSGHTDEIYTLKGS